MEDLRAWIFFVMDAARIQGKSGFSPIPAVQPKHGKRTPALPVTEPQNLESTPVKRTILVHIEFPNEMLRVTKLTDYATVVLTVLAARPAEVLSATELAEAAGLEPPTVSKLLKPLAQAKLVEGLRGVRGGYRL